MFGLRKFSKNLKTERFARKAGYFLDEKFINVKRKNLPFKGQIF
jgi:hypothetical protein